MTEARLCGARALARLVGNAATTRPPSAAVPCSLYVKISRILTDCWQAPATIRTCAGSLNKGSARPRMGAPGNDNIEEIGKYASFAVNGVACGRGLDQHGRTNALSLCTLPG